MLDQVVIGLLDWLERVVRSNVLFAVLLAAVVSLLIAAGWWSLSRCLNVRFRPIADISANSDAAVMRLWRLAVIAGLLVHGAAASAAPADFRPVPTTRQLRGLTSEEATTLLGKLEDAQRRLKAGEPQYFELLAGSIASYDIIKSSPRDVFLQVPFNQVWNIERVRTDNRLWQPYRLAYSPNGLGRIYWEIEVALGFNGDIQRVLMTYKPPAPF